MIKNIYLASALSEYAVIEERAQILRLHNYEIVSNWHGIVAKQAEAIDPNDQSARFEIYKNNLTDINSAQILIADTRNGKPCATFSEIGYALGIKIPVIWIQPEILTNDGIRRTNIFDAGCYLIKHDYDHGSLIGLIQLVQRTRHL